MGILQDRCGFLSDKDFINALECNSIDGVDFGRRDAKIASKIYGYSKGAVMGRFKHPQIGVKMDRTTEDVVAPLSPKILEHYKDIHLEYRHTICEPDSIPISDSKRHWIYTL